MLGRGSKRQGGRGEEGGSGSWGLLTCLKTAYSNSIADRTSTGLPRGKTLQSWPIPLLGESVTGASRVEMGSC
jgi:hypothetical protein